MPGATSKKEDQQFNRLLHAAQQEMALRRQKLNKALYHAAKNNVEREVNELIRQGAVVDPAYGYALQLLPKQSSLIVVEGCPEKN